MHERISEFARWFLADPARQADLTVPVLLWHAPPTAVDAGAPLELTRARILIDTPTPREPLVLPLRKQTARPNAFGMGVTVGRADNNDLPVNDPSISRFHAYFQNDPDSRKSWKLVDAESRNGTWVGPLQISPNAPVELHDGVRLRFGSVEMLYLTPHSFFAYVDGMIGGGAVSPRRGLRLANVPELSRDPPTDPDLHG